MKTPVFNMRTALCLFQAACCLPAFGQGAAFTYQGHLADEGAPATGFYDMEFRLYDQPVDGVQQGATFTREDLAVTNGLFTVLLNFGGSVFDGSDRYLEIAVRPGSSTEGHTPLALRQRITATPYALRAATLSGPIGPGQLAGSYSNAVTLGNPANRFSGDGSGLAGVDAGTLEGRDAGSFWQLGGNAGTAPSSPFLGTTDNQPLDLRVNHQRGLRLEPTATTPHVIGGSSANNVAPGLTGATIAGGGLTNFPNTIRESFATVGGGTFNRAGGQWSTIAGGRDNAASGHHSTVAGGFANQIGISGENAAIAGGKDNLIESSLGAIGGGQNNRISTNAPVATVAGGRFNRVESYAGTIAGGETGSILPNSDFATIAGGSFNTIRTDSWYSTISGGLANEIHPNTWNSVIGGGDLNIVGTNGNHAAIGGGQLNFAGASWTTVAGGRDNRVEARHATVSGGRLNQVQANADHAAIAGGRGNAIGAGSAQSAIGGGLSNMIATGASDAVIGGGWANHIQRDSVSSTVSGGSFNTMGSQAFFNTISGGMGNFIDAGCLDSTVAGGSLNWMGRNNMGSIVAGGVGHQIGSNTVHATIAGGSSNRIASGASYAWAAGRLALAAHQGAFVWADSQNATFTSTAANQFNVRAAGGARFVGPDNSGATAALVVQSGPDQMLMDGNELDSSGNLFLNFNSGNNVLLANPATRLAVGFSAPAHPIHHASGAHLTAAGVWTSVSDRNAKEDFAPVDKQALLARVAALPVAQWKYKAERDGVKHIGPVAQDFHAAFGVGESDTGLAGLDVGGVALAAIQGLNEKVDAGAEDAAAALRSLQAENARLKARLERLEQLLLHP